MTTDYHDPLTTGMAATAAGLEAPLAQLDAAIGQLGAGLSQIAAPITLTDGEAAAGQKVIPVASTTGFLAGMTIFIGDGVTLESRVIDTISAGVSITVTVNLSNTYAAGKIVSASPMEVVLARGSEASLLAHLMARKAFLGFQILTVGSGTYTPTAGAVSAWAEAIGGGGGSGGCAQAATNAAASGGGGGGAYASVWIANLTASYAYAVGAAGAAGASGANNGGDGGDTTLGSGPLLCAKGGGGSGADTVAAGPRMAGAPGLGGAEGSCVGDVKMGGQDGGIGIALAAAQACGGGGGMAAGPGGGGGRGRSITGTGIAGHAYGGGGGGSCILSGGASQAGIVGAAGLLRIWEFK